MTIETIKQGMWVVTEGGVPEYSIYKLLQGKISVYKGGVKIREVEVKDGDAPIMIGITAVLRPDLMHMASVRADSDLEVDRTYIDQIKGVLNNNVPVDLKRDLQLMSQTITMGNEMLSLAHRFTELVRVDPEIPDNLDDETTEILTEIKRLYTLITADVDKMCS